MAKLLKISKKIKKQMEKAKKIAIIFIIALAVIMAAILVAFVFYSININSKIGDDLKKELSSLKKDETIKVIVLLKDIPENLKQFEKTGIKIESISKNIPVFAVEVSKSQLTSLAGLNLVSKIVLDKPISGKGYCGGTESECNSCREGYKCFWTSGGCPFAYDRCGDVCGFKVVEGNYYVDGKYYTSGAAICCKCSDSGENGEEDGETSGASADDFTAAGQGFEPPEGLTGDGVRVAVIDTGIDYNHPALAGRVIGHIDTINNDDNAMDDNGHGTFVAGIIASNDSDYPGLAPGVSLLAAKVLDSNNSGTYGTLLRGLDWAVSERADVINLSVTGNDEFNSTCDQDVLSYAVNYIIENYALPVVVSAGNAGARGMNPPACASQAISAGAVDRFGYVPWWSSRGEELDILAPGVRISSLYPGRRYVGGSGTSFSAPYVTAIVALLLEKEPEARVNDIKNTLYNSVIEASGCAKCLSVMSGICVQPQLAGCNRTDTGNGILYYISRAVSDITATPSEGEQEEGEEASQAPDDVVLPGLDIGPVLIQPNPLPAQFPIVFPLEPGEEEEKIEDSDGDGIPDYLDDDCNGDGIPDTQQDPWLPCGAGG